MNPSRGSSAHVQEGRGRSFGKAAPVDTLFETQDVQDERRKLHKALDYFPTPPWAVRAILAMLDGIILPGMRVIEPACGRGHCVAPLREAGLIVDAADIHDHGAGFSVADFLAPPLLSRANPEAEPYDWLITNPPFSHAEAFVRRGLEIAENVLVLCRLSFLCSEGRHELHRSHLHEVYPFCERVCMALGVYDPAASFATETAWFWFKRVPGSHHPFLPMILHIPPGQKDRFFRPEDIRL